MNHNNTNINKKHIISYIVLIFTFLLFSLKGIHLNSNHHHSKINKNLQHKSQILLQKDKRLWSGYAPNCDQQCEKANGVTCGNVIKSCCTQGSCLNKYKFSYCVQYISNFECNPGNSPYSVYDAFPIQKYPQLEGLFQKEQKK